MASMKSMINVVLDVGPSMAQPVQPGNPGAGSKLALAKGLIGHFFLQRIMASKTVELGVTTIGDNVTRNHLNKTMKGGYEHINEVAAIARPSPEELLRAVDGISGGSFAGDFIEGIVAAMDALVRVNAGKAFNRILLLVTDAETAVEGVEDLEAILPQMQDLKNFALYIAVVGKVDAAASSAVKVENVKLLQSLAEQSGAGRCLEVASLGDAAQLLSAGLGLSTKPTLSKITLELSPEVRVPCAYYGPVSATPLPSLKKRPRLAAASAADDDVDDTAAALKRDIVYRDPDDAEREVDASLKVKGYRYGAQFVPVTTADEAALKAPFAGPPTVRVIGFVAAASIPRHHLLDKAMVLLAAATSGAAQRLVTSLRLALRQDERVALCRVSKRDGAEPFLGALQPLADDDASCGLLLHRLPCAEDVRDHNFPSLVAFASEAQLRKDPQRRRQAQAMAALVAAATVPTDCPLQRVLTPANPTLQGVLCEVRRRLLRLPQATPPPEDTLVAPVALPAALLREVQAAFPLERVVKRGRKRKQFFSELQTDAAGSAAADEAHAAADEDDAARVAERSRFAEEMRLERGQLESKDAPAAAEDEEDEELPPFAASSVTPAADFTALVEALCSRKRLADGERRLAAKAAFDTMRGVVDASIRQGASRAAYAQAVECLLAWRAAAQRLQDCAAFNAYLDMPLKKVHSRGRHALVWALLCEAQCGPLSVADVASSTLSEAAAVAFLSGGSAAASQSLSQHTTPPPLRPADEDRDDF